MRQALDRTFLRRLYDGLAGRYDWQHALATGWSDGRGRRALVAATVQPGDLVLDAGTGTGSTALTAARAGGGHICLMDWSRGMLTVARQKLRAAASGTRVSIVAGDIERPPFRTGTFDVVLSTYSTCPLTDPSGGAAALYDLVRPGGLLGIAHSAEPVGRVSRGLAGVIEVLAWRLPALSMGCRPVSVLPTLRALGAIVESDRRLGVPLWPFHVFVVRKPGPDFANGPAT
jgi:ubiquinone/menaquinone biosynthesis C-methylase UbiE